MPSDRASSSYSARRLPFAGDHERRVRVVGRDPRGGADDVLRPLLRRQAGAESDHDLRARRPIPGRRRDVGMKALGVDAVRDDDRGRRDQRREHAPDALAAADQQVGRVQRRPRAQGQPLERAALGAARAPDDRNPELPRDRRRRDPRERHRRVDDVGAPLAGDALNVGRDAPDAAQIAPRQREAPEAARLRPAAGKIGRVNRDLRRRIRAASRCRTCWVPSSS